MLSCTETSRLVALLVEELVGKYVGGGGVPREWRRRGIDTNGARRLASHTAGATDTSLRRASNPRRNPVHPSRTCTGHNGAPKRCVPPLLSLKPFVAIRLFAHRHVQTRNLLREHNNLLVPWTCLFVNFSPKRIFWDI